MGRPLALPGARKRDAAVRDRVARFNAVDGYRPSAHVTPLNPGVAFMERKRAFAKDGSLVVRSE